MHVPIAEGRLRRPTRARLPTARSVMRGVRGLCGAARNTGSAEVEVLSSATFSFLVWVSAIRRAVKRHASGHGRVLKKETNFTQTGTFQTLMST